MDLGPIRPDGQSFASRAAAGLESGRELSRLSAGFGSVCSTPDIRRCLTHCCDGPLGMSLTGAASPQHFAVVMKAEEPASLALTVQAYDMLQWLQ